MREGEGEERQWVALAALAPVCIQQSRHVDTHTHVAQQMQARNVAGCRNGALRDLAVVAAGTAGSLSGSVAKEAGGNLL